MTNYYDQIALFFSKEYGLVTSDDFVYWREWQYFVHAFKNRLKKSNDNTQSENTQGQPNISAMTKGVTRNMRMPKFKTPRM